MIDTVSQKKKGRSLVLFPLTYIVFDIETTGLSPDEDEIIEISALKFENKELVDTFSTLVRPSCPISLEITKITGITKEMVKDAPGITDVIPLFKRFVGDFLLVGHNVNFDLDFVTNAALALGIQPFCNDFVDTLRLSRRYVRELEHHRLIDMAHYFQIDATGNHRALKDCEITNALLWKLEKKKDEQEKTLKKFTSRYGMNTRANAIVAQTRDFDSNHPCYQKYFVITGTLANFPRKVAMQKIVNLGGFCQDRVNDFTNFVVLGDNHENPLLKGRKSSKQQEAEWRIEQGQNIVFLTEEKFYEMILNERMEDCG